MDVTGSAVVRDPRLFPAVFAAVFAAEVGDKTQLATVLCAPDARNPKRTVPAGAAAALIVTSAIEVLAGSLVSRCVRPAALSWAAGLGLIAVGVWTILRG